MMNFSYDDKLNELKIKVYHEQNIGMDLIELLDNKAFLKELHMRAKWHLKNSLVLDVGTRVSDPALVFISLVCIGFSYDGAFYDAVQNTYEELYEISSRQRIEGLIRDVLRKFKPKNASRKDERMINYALRQTIVPQAFLPEFFEFIYDIYRLNLEYSLPENLYEEFEFVYHNLDGSKGSFDELEVNCTNKTYKLIQTTKCLINEDSSALTELSVEVVKLIDSRVWDKNPTIKNSYYNYGYEMWEANYSHDTERNGMSGSRSSWKPKFELRYGCVYLVPPVHKIRDLMNGRSVIAQVYCGERLVYESRQMDVNIQEIMGGYRIRVNDIKLDDPLNEVRYVLKADNRGVYSSGASLHREVLAFNEEGVEVRNNKGYEGRITFCYKNRIPELEVSANRGTYLLSSKSVKYEDVFVFGNEVFNCSGMIVPNVYGSICSKATVSSLDGNETLPVFTKLKFLMFECKDEQVPTCLYVNERMIPLKSLNVEQSYRGGVHKFVIPSNIENPGVYRIRIPNIKSFDFVYDPTFESCTKRRMGDEYELHVTSSFYDEELIRVVELKHFDKEPIDFFYGGMKYRYEINFGFELYRINGGEWRKIGVDTMNEKDLGLDSYLELYGGGYSSYQICGRKNHEVSINPVADSVALEQDKLIQRISIGYFNRYKAEYEMLLILLFKNDGPKPIECFLRCVIREKDIHFDLNQFNGNLKFQVTYDGIGDVSMELTRSDGFMVLCKSQVDNGEWIETTVPSSGEYELAFYEKAKGLSLLKKKELCKIPMNIILFNDMAGRRFSLVRAHYDVYCNEAYRQRDLVLRGVHIKLTQLLKDGRYLGDLYSDTPDGKFYLYHLNPVTVELCGCAEDMKMDVFITKDEDGVLLDLQHSNILNALTDQKAPDVYLIEMKLDN